MRASSHSRDHGGPALLGWLCTTFIAAAIASLGARGGANFYRLLDMPDWAPAAFVFGPVWLALYATMAVAAWRIWNLRLHERRRTHSLALMFFMVQLIVNAAWSWCFFGLHSGALAFLDSCVLLVLVTLTTVAFWSQDRLAGSLMAIYCGWLLNATVLTFYAWRWNPQLLG